MGNTYKVTVNDSFEFLCQKEEADLLDIQNLSASKYHVLKDMQSFKVEILKSGFIQRIYEVRINSNVYKVDIFNELDLLIEEMGLSLGTAQLINSIKAPMPGLILEVNVKEGDQVKEGDYLMVLEAMKMENTIIAPRDAVVKSITIKKGETVEKNQLLIEME